MVSAAQIVANTALWPINTVAYSQALTNSPTGHRKDCSGYASMCLGLPTPGESTVTLVTKNLVRPILESELHPGDLIGKLGPGTGGDNGHVQVYVGRTASGGYVVMEQAIGATGPDRSVYKSISPDYRCYRFVGNTGGDVLTPEQARMLTDIWYALFIADSPPRPPGSLAGTLARIDKATAGGEPGDGASAAEVADELAKRLVS